MLMKPVTEQKKAGPSETCSVASNDEYSLMYVCQKYLHINQHTACIFFYLFRLCFAISQFLSKCILQLPI